MVGALAVAKLWGSPRPVDRLMVLIGTDPDHIAADGSYFTPETHPRHLDEIGTGGGQAFQRDFCDVSVDTSIR